MYCRKCGQKVGISHTFIHELEDIRRDEETGTVVYNYDEDPAPDTNISICDCLTLHNEEIKLLEDLLDGNYIIESNSISKDDPNLLEIICELDLDDYEDFLDDDNDIIIDKVIENIKTNITINDIGY